MKSNGPFIVVFDDEQGACFPMAWDNDCQGALCVVCGNDPVALFGSRNEARAAIIISTAFAKLQKALGKSENTDFTESRKYVRIKPCAARIAMETKG